MVNYQTDPYFIKVKSFIDKIYNGRVKHFERTVDYLLLLDPRSDIAEIIAAYSHDNERTVNEEKAKDQVLNSKYGFLDPIEMKKHQKQSAKRIKKFLIENDFPRNICDDVYNLVLHHEIGGNKKTNLLKDSDSISFLEVNADHFIEKFVPIFGKVKVKEKIDWMYKRITNKKAIDLAKPFYEDAISKINKKIK